MALTPIQRRFVAIFVGDGEYSLLETCRAAGVLPSEAMTWFRDDKFQAAIRQYDSAQLAAMGYGPLRALREMLALAHSNIADVQMVDGDLKSLPLHVQLAIKKVKFKLGMKADGKAFLYPESIEMHDKLGALKTVVEWFDVANAPEVKKAAATSEEDGPKRITGLIVRPPLTKDEREIEDLLS